MQTVLWIPDNHPPLTKTYPDTIIRSLPLAAIIREATNLLATGELVAFPTETVYGLGANALDQQALARVFAAKGRPSDNPLIAHVASLSQVAMLSDQVPTIAWELMSRFWPGPLSILLPALPTLPMQLTAGLPHVAVRMPRHAIARALIASLGHPIAAPSANLSGRPSPTTPDHVLTDLAGRIGGVISSGACEVGIESTVVAIDENRIVILRPGQISGGDLEQLGYTVRYDAGLDDRDVKAVPRAPGQKYRHYAPTGQLTVVIGPDEKMIDYIQSGIRKSRAANLRVGVLYLAEEHYDEADLSIRLGVSRQSDEIARNLYSALRTCDDQMLDVIFVEGLPDQESFRAIGNRLYKAASGRVVQV